MTANDHLPEGKLSLNGACEQGLDIPEAIYNEYSLRGPAINKLRLVSDNDRPPQAQYQDAKGFSYPWGQIIVRHSDNKAFWDFVLVELLNAYHRNGLLLCNMQQDCLSALEKVAPHLIDYEPSTSRLNLVGCHIHPGTAVNAFGVSCHFSQCEKTLAWLNEEFLPIRLPKVIDLCGKMLKRRTGDA